MPEGITLHRRVVVVATLAGARSEAGAIEVLRLVPELSDLSVESLRRITRWLHKLYPGPNWWNPLEPDLVAEHIVATEFSDAPDLLALVLRRDSPERMSQFSR